MLVEHSACTSASTGIGGTSVPQLPAVLIQRGKGIIPAAWHSRSALHLCCHWRGEVPVPRPVPHRTLHLYPLS